MIRTNVTALDYKDGLGRLNQTIRREGTLSAFCRKHGLDVRKVHDALSAKGRRISDETWAAAGLRWALVEIPQTGEDEAQK